MCVCLDEDAPESSIVKALQAFKKHQEEQLNGVQQHAPNPIPSNYHFGNSRRRQSTRERDEDDGDASTKQVESCTTRAIRCCVCVLWLLANCPYISSLSIATVVAIANSTIAQCIHLLRGKHNMLIFLLTHELFLLRNHKYCVKGLIALLQLSYFFQSTLCYLKWCKI